MKNLRRSVERVTFGLDHSPIYHRAEQEPVVYDREDGLSVIGDSAMQVMTACDESGYRDVAITLPSLPHLKEGDIPIVEKDDILFSMLEAILDRG